MLFFLIFNKIILFIYYFTVISVENKFNMKVITSILYLTQKCWQVLIKGKDLILKKIKEKGYICGNGGSSSISNHLLVILTRGLSTLLKEKF